MQDYFAGGDSTGLEIAAQFWRATIASPDFSSLPHEEQLQAFAEAGPIFLLRYRVAGYEVELAAAIASLQLVVSSLEPGDTRRPAYLTYLADALHERFSRRADPKDLYRAIELYQEALRLLPSDAPGRTGTLSNLAIAVRERYLLDGHEEDLDEALELFRTAEQALTPDSQEWPLAIHNLGAGLRDRFLRVGSLSDLDEAVRLLNAAVKATPANSPDRPIRLNSLGLALLDRARRIRHVADLEGAVAAFEAAVAAVPRQSPWRAGLIQSLGNGWSEMYKSSGRLEHVEHSVAAYREAVTLTPQAAPELAARLSSLGLALRDRYLHARHGNDLDEAIRTLDQALRLSDPDSPSRSALLLNRALALRDRFERDGKPEDARRAIEGLRDSCIEGLTDDPSTTLQASRRWSRWALQRGSWDEAVSASKYGLDVMQRLFRLQLVREHKEAWLQAAGLLPATAAYARARTGDLEGAVVALEAGRALFLSEALERDRINLADLGRIGRGDLADRYHQAAVRLAALEVPSTDTQALAEAREELDAAVVEIRNVPGFERFLAQPSFDDVATIASSAHLAYLVATEAGGLALIVRDQATVTPIWLPSLTQDSLTSRLRELFAVYAARRDDLTTWPAQLNAIARWLWDTAMGPVLNALGSVPQAVLVPAGLLGLLPLHAAWTEDPAAPTGRRYALDEVLLTYVPNARALRESRRLAEQLQADRLLAVDEPRPIQAPPLPSAAHETAAACAAFAPHARRLRHEQATRQAVADALDEASVLHLACHGYADLITPLDSGLVLASDEPLHLRDLFPLRLAARLAVLSACETALPGTDLPDEVISLPTGLLQAGVAGVVASLWAVPDDRTMLLMVDFYQRWRHQGLAPAEALRQAQRWLRDSTNGEKRERFGALLQGGEGTWLPRATAEACWEAVVLEDPDGRSFADPTGWAAFTYIGA